MGLQNGYGKETMRAGFAFFPPQAFAAGATKRPPKGSARSRQGSPEEAERRATELQKQLWAAHFSVCGCVYYNTNPQRKS